MVIITPCGERTYTPHTVLHLTPGSHFSASVTVLRVPNGYFTAIASTGAQVCVPELLARNTQNLHTVRYVSAQWDLAEVERDMEDS